MNIDERIETLKAVIVNFGKIFGPNTEISLYDLRKPGIAALENGHVSGRKVGFQPDPAVLATLDSSVDESGCLVGMSRTTKDGREIRASHFLLKNEDGIPYARICVNQDMTQLSNIRDSITALMGVMESAEGVIGGSGNIVQQTCRNLIMREIQAHLPAELQNREVKTQIIAELYRKGIFDIKDSVSQVCTLLNISQTTLYNTLRDIRSQENLTNRRF